MYGPRNRPWPPRVTLSRVAGSQPVPISARLVWDMHCKTANLPPAVHISDKISPAAESVVHMHGWAGKRGLSVHMSDKVPRYP